MSSFNQLLLLDEFEPLPEFPLDYLPVSLAEYANEIAQTVQCAPDMPATAIIAAAATALARCGEVCVGATHKEPLNIWAIIAADPSERKSETFKKAFAPIYKRQSDILKEMQKDIDDSHMQHRLDKARLSKLESKYANAKDVNLDELRYEIEAMQKNMQEPIKAPRFTSSDVTPETMATILVDNGGRISIVDAEGAGPIANAFGRYSESGTKMENMLRSYRGDTMQVDRRERREIVFCPALTVAIALQPGVLKRMGKRPEARDQGFTARFLYSIPTTKAGKRLYQNRQIDKTIQDMYNDAILGLTQIPTVTTVAEEPEMPQLYITGKGLDEWTKYHDDLEVMMAAMGKMENHRDYAGKLAGHAARLAGIFALVDCGRSALNKPIPNHCVSMAVALMRDYYQPHGMEAFRMMYDAGGNVIASRIVEWIKRHRHDEERYPFFTHAQLWRDLRRGADMEDSSDLDNPIKTLIEHGYLCECEQENNQKGRPSSKRYEVNPLVC
jgi:replicative DNA helicase